MGPVRLYYYCTRGLNGFRARTCGFKCLEWPKSRTQTTRNADQDVERWKVSFIASGNANGTVTLEGSPNSFLQNEPLLPHTLAVTPLGILPNELKAYVYTKTFTQMFTAASVTIAECRKPPRCTSVGEWINKLWSIQTMGYYSVLKKE